MVGQLMKIPSIPAGYLVYPTLSMYRGGMVGQLERIPSIPGYLTLRVRYGGTTGEDPKYPSYMG